MSAHNLLLEEGNLKYGDIEQLEKSFLICLVEIIKMKLIMTGLIWHRSSYQIDLILLGPGMNHVSIVEMLFAFKNKN